MDVSIKINIDNAAFKPIARLEIARILQDLAKTLEEDYPDHNRGKALLRDVNRNTVRYFKIGR